MIIPVHFITVILVVNISFDQLLFIFLVDHQDIRVDDLMVSTMKINLLLDDNLILLVEVIFVLIHVILIFILVINLILFLFFTIVIIMWMWSTYDILLTFTWFLMSNQRLNFMHLKVLLLGERALAMDVIVVIIRICIHKSVISGLSILILRSSHTFIIHEA